jgi:hypothetical protein
MLPADNEGPGSRPRSRARQFTPAGFAASGRMHRLGKRESARDTTGAVAVRRAEVG